MSVQAGDVVLVSTSSWSCTIVIGVVEAAVVAGSGRGTGLNGSCVSPWRVPLPLRLRFGLGLGMGVMVVSFGFVGPISFSSRPVGVPNGERAEDLRIRCVTRVKRVLTMLNMSRAAGPNTMNPAPETQQQIGVCVFLCFMLTDSLSRGHGQG